MKTGLCLLATKRITPGLIRTAGVLDEQETVAPPYDPGRTTLTDAPAARSAVSGVGGGDRIGPYLLKRKLGEGGMGVVYEALQERPLRRKVALKLIKPGMDSRQVLARFDSERQALALMNHPNIAKVLDAGTTEGGQPYFVMEYVQGDTITNYCDRHELSTQQRLELFVSVCAGIQHAHQKGIIHRDLNWITMKALEKERARRYGSAAELADDLQRFMNHEPVTAGPPSATYRARKFVRRHRMGVAVAATLLISVLAGATLSTIGFVRAVRAERVARFEADTSGQVYRSLGLYDAALPLLMSAVDARREAFGTRSPEVAGSRYVMAGVLLKQRRPTEAEPLLQDALAAYGRALAILDTPEAPDDPRLARILNNLGTIHRNAGRYEEARKVTERALEIRERILGPEHPELVTTLVNLGETNFELKRYERAGELLQRAVDLGLRVRPEGDALVTRAAERLSEMNAAFR